MQIHCTPSAVFIDCDISHEKNKLQYRIERAFHGITIPPCTDTAVSRFYILCARTASGHIKREPPKTLGSSHIDPYQAIGL